MRWFGWLLMMLGLLGPVNVAGIDSPTPRYILQERTWITAAPVPVASPGALLKARVFLPVIVFPYATPIQFGAGMQGNALIDPSDRFAAGITTLYYRVDVGSMRGQPYHEEWSINGIHKPELDANGIIPTNAVALINAVALSTSAPLPSGIYTVHFFVNGKLTGTASASIE